MAKKAKRVKSRKAAKRKAAKQVKRVKSRKAADASAAAGYKGHRKGSLAEKLRKVYDAEGVEAARKLAKRMEAKGEIASHTYRSFFSLWGRKVVPGSGKPRGRKNPIPRVKSTKAGKTSKRRVKSTKAGKSTKAAKAKAAKRAPKRAAKKAVARRVRSVKAEPAAAPAAAA